MEQFNILVEKLLKLKEELSKKDIDRIALDKRVGSHVIKQYLNGSVKFEEVGNDILERGLIILEEKKNLLIQVIHSLK